MASVSSSRDSRFKTNPSSPLLKYVEMVQQLPRGGGYIKICSHCKEQYNSSYSRVKAHLCFIPQKGITSCTSKSKVPGEPQSKTLLVNSIAIKYIEEQRQVDEAIGNAIRHPLDKSKSKRGSRASIASVSNQEPIEGHPFLHIPQEPMSNKRAKGPLVMAFHNEGRDIVEQDIARCIYANGLAFNVVHST